MSVTALAEYADMLFTRAHLALGGRDWWLEMRPVRPTMDPKGIVLLKAYVRGPAPNIQLFGIEHIAKMHAIEENAQISMKIMEEVIDHHVTEFVRKIRMAEEEGVFANDGTP